MAAPTYAILIAAKSTTGSIRSWVMNDSIPAEEVVRLAEGWLEHRLRVRRMEARGVVPVAEGDSAIVLSTALPRFLDPIDVWVQGYGRVNSIDAEDMENQRQVDTDGTMPTGVPTLYATVGEELLFDVETDAAYNVVVVYYARPEALATASTNVYTERYEALFKMVCLGFAYVFDKDPPMAESMFKAAADEIANLESNDDLYRRGQILNVEVR